MKKSTFNLMLRKFAMQFLKSSNLILIVTFLQVLIYPLSANTQEVAISFFQKDNNEFYLYINNERQVPFVGMVFQPVPDGLHINDIKYNQAKLFASLLPDSLGGQGFGKRIKDMGIDFIRVYELPIDNILQVDSIKLIFNYLLDNYGIRVLICDWAGLYEPINWSLIEQGIFNYNFQYQSDRRIIFGNDLFTDIEFYKIIERIHKLVKIYCTEQWVLGWQIGNENNYYIKHGRLKKRIGLNQPNYYNYMDFIASELRNELNNNGVTQFIGLGQGDLTLAEAKYISRMRNIDAVGITCYRAISGKENIEKLLQLAATLDRPVYLSEIGIPTYGNTTEALQSKYLQQISQVIFSYSSSKKKGGCLIGAIICEATDEQWKSIEHGVKADAHFGVLGKEAEKEFGLWIKRNKDFERTLPFNDDPVNLLTSCWNLLQGNYAIKYGPSYGDCISIADRLINLYQNQADSQQLTLINSKSLIKAGANDSLWALNSVGTAFFIKGRCKMEIFYNTKGAGQINNANLFLKEAKKDFTYVQEKYPYAHIRSCDGEYYSVHKVIRNLFPELSEPYIKFDLQNLIIFVIIPFLLITHFFRYIYKKIKKIFQRKNDNEIIINVDIMTPLDKSIFAVLVLGQLFALFYFITYWYHPVRLEFYTVNRYLFWILTSIGATTIFFYFYIWYIIWAMKKPIHIAPPQNKKCAMVTTYVHGEPIDMIEETLKKMVEVLYPHDTYLLDESNDDKLKLICQKVGSYHFSRKGIDKYNTRQGRFQRKTKGGNLNSWLDIYGNKYEFVTFLDPDHAPLNLFLDRVLGYFKDPGIGFVQAPQIFKNSSENMITQGASEQSYFFFGPIQQGLYGLGSCMLNGSHTTIRIKAINDIGSYAVHDADDVLTSIRLKVKGYRGVHIPEIIATGLAPNTINSFFKQQKRWAASVFNLMFYHYPLYLFRDYWNQAFTYYVFSLFYFMGLFFAILIFLPIISIFTNQAIVNADFFVFLQKFSPYLLLHYFILVVFGQRFIINGGSKKGFWYKGGILWVGSWWHFIKAFYSGISKRTVRDREITAKQVKLRETTNLEFIPHLIVIVLSILALLYSFFIPGAVKYTRGMQIFLCVNIVLQSIIYLFSSEEFLKRLRKMFLYFSGWVSIRRR